MPIWLQQNGSYMRQNVSNYSKLLKYRNSKLYVLLDGAMNDQMKQEIRRKVKTYIERAEKIKGTADQKPPENQPASSKPTRPREEEKDPDKMRMKQKFEGQFYHVYFSHVNIVISL